MRVPLCPYRPHALSQNRDAPLVCGESHTLFAVKTVIPMFPKRNTWADRCRFEETNPAQWATRSRVYSHSERDSPITISHRPYSYRRPFLRTAWRSLPDARLRMLRDQFSPAFSGKAFGIAKLLVTIQVDLFVIRSFHQISARSGHFPVTRNRILLTRAIEEAEGYTELGMLRARALRFATAWVASSWQSPRLLPAWRSVARAGPLRRSPLAAPAQRRPDARRYSRLARPWLVLQAHRPACEGD